MFELNNLKPARGATKDRFRVGRGQGSGNGTTAGRGIKGQRSRSGGSGAGWFEGGQMPLYRRIPKSGFAPPNRVPYQVLNLADFERFDASETVTPDTLAAMGMVSGRNPRVKVLGVGDVNAAFRVSVHAISASAREKIEAKGGSVEILPWSRTGRTDG
ncbi:MAG: 50S ribosomal protein L15 [bacterium]